MNYSKLLLVFPAILAFSLNGCYTAKVLTGVKETKPTTLLESDKILAFAELSSSSLDQTGKPDSFVIIGENHSYFLDWGKQELTQISSKLDPNNIEIDSSNPRLYLDGDQISGVIYIKYKLKSPYKYNNDEYKTLKSLRFIQSNYDRNIYEYIFNTKGTIYPKMDLSNYPTKFFTHSRNISFYSRAIIEPTSKAQKGLILPIAIAADTVTLPVQILGGSVLLVIFSSTKH